MITFEDVKAAYEKTGLKPKAHVTLKDGCACPLGALYASLGDYVGDYVGGLPLDRVAAILGIASNQAYSVAEGFDGRRDPEWECRDEEYYALGVKCRELLG